MHQYINIMAFTMLLTLIDLEHVRKRMRIFEARKHRCAEIHHLKLPMSSINWNGLTNEQIVGRLGEAIKRLRLERNMSQGDVAQHTGLDRSTVQRLEGGRPATLLTVVQVLRALDRLQLLDHWAEERTATPMMLLEQEEAYQRKKRKRAGRHRPPIDPPKPKSTW